MVTLNLMLKSNIYSVISDFLLTDHSVPESPCSGRALVLLFQLSFLPLFKGGPVTSKNILGFKWTLHMGYTEGLSVDLGLVWVADIRKVTFVGLWH